MQKVKNAATHLKEGAADAVNTVKHGGKNQKEGENDERVVHGEQHFGEVCRAAQVCTVYRLLHVQIHMAL